MAFSSSNGARSLVNNYELALLEANHMRQLPNSAKLYKCFQTFDEIIPMLGQYKRVMKMIRDQVYEAVFSQQYTVDIELEPVTLGEPAKNGAIERIPHFEILNKIVDERNSRAEIAEEQVEQLKNVVGELNDEISANLKIISEMEATISKQQEEIHNLQTSLVLKGKENNQLDVELRYQQEKMNRLAKDFRNSMKNLHEQLVQESSKVSELSRFKKCHDEVQDEFRDPTVFSPAIQKGVFSAKEQKIRKDIAEGATLEKQLLLLRNTCIDEYDQHLEDWQKGKENSEKHINASGEAVRLNDKPSKLLKDETRERHETAFVNMITNIENELAQNLQHLSILKNDLEKINETKRQSNRDSENLRTHGGADDSIEDSQLLELIKDASMNYKFVPQEPILSKYALAVLYSCNQGKTFQELPDVQECKSCAAKTLVCPHKATADERVFHLPLQCTHIKFTRPELQVSHAPHIEIPAKTMKLPEEVKSQKVYPRLWDDLVSREHDNNKRASRILKTDFLVSIIEQFYASVVLNDIDNGSEKLVPMLDAWYAFLNHRYQSNSVAVLVARDVMETIQNSVPLQPLVQLFAECLCGNLDPAAFRYFLILRRLVQIVQWTSLEDFTSFCNIVYPFMDVDDMEQLTMSYRAFSKNKIDESLVRDFFLSLILKQREPAFHDVENQLLTRPEISSGVMVDTSFFEFMAEISPLSSELLCQRLYGQSQADTEGNHVSITRLSQIAGYVVLHQQAAVMEMEIRKKLQIE